MESCLSPYAYKALEYQLLHILFWIYEFDTDNVPSLRLYRTSPDENAFEDSCDASQLLFPIVKSEIITLMH